MHLTVVIPNRQLKKKSISGATVIESRVLEGEEYFTFRDSRLDNVINLLNSLYIPFVDCSSITNTSFLKSTLNSFKNPPTYFCDAVPNSYVEEQIQKEAKDGYILTDLTLYSRSIDYVYVLESEDVTLYLNYNKVEVITSMDMVTYPRNNTDLNTIVDLSKPFKLSYYSDSSKKESMKVFNRLHKTIKKAQEDDIKTLIEFEPTFLNQGYKFLFCYPTLINSTIPLNMFNKMLNKIEGFKTKGFAKLTVSNKWRDINTRLDSLFTQCLSKIDHNFKTYCGGISDWSTCDANTYRDNIDSSTQLKRPSSEPWNHVFVESNSKDVIEEDKTRITNTAHSSYKFNILEKYLLSLDPLPFSISNKLEKEYSDFLINLFSLYLYSRYIKNSLFPLFKESTRYIGRTSYLDSFEKVPFSRIAVMLPSELTKVIFNNIKKETAMTPIFKAHKAAPVIARKKELISIDLDDNYKKTYLDILSAFNDSDDTKITDLLNSFRIT